MSISKEATVDAPELLAILKGALAGFLIQLAVHRFALPLTVRIVAPDGELVREFSIEKTGQLVLGRSDDVNGIYPLPLTLAATEPGGRVAKMTVSAARVAGPVEFVN